MGTEFLVNKCLNNEKVMLFLTTLTIKQFCLDDLVHLKGLHLFWLARFHLMIEGGCHLALSLSHSKKLIACVDARFFFKEDYLLILLLIRLEYIVVCPTHGANVGIA